MNIGMIPVRSGSERLAKKNYLKLGGSTVLEIAIEKAVRSKAFDYIYVNTDDENLEEVASRMGVRFHLRDKVFATSLATSDQVVLDFFSKIDGEKVFWVNTASPLQPVEDITHFVDLSRTEGWRSAVSVNTSSLHAVSGGRPINFEWRTGFARTQDLRPITAFNYAMMGWSRSMVDTLKRGQLFDENTQFVESSRWSSFLLKNSDDMRFIREMIDVAPV